MILLTFRELTTPTKLFSGFLQKIIYFPFWVYWLSLQLGRLNRTRSLMSLVNLELRNFKMEDLLRVYSLFGSCIVIANNE